jgi:glucan phosphoethanolaminetransferase (alkaline phosphatase superfamily)
MRWPPVGKEDGSWCGVTGLPRLPHWAQPPVEVNAFAQSWPFGVVARGLDFYKERVYLADCTNAAPPSASAPQADPTKAPDVMVLVLGESSRFDRWSLNGYARDDQSAAVAGAEPGRAAAT